MWIEEIVLDGFKSYGTKTRIHGFDRAFNAITGLNGSGKSNILDAICFVLGITNLSKVRVTSLKELIYKQGQAGITKATVSIIFNNEDRRASPTGYEEFKKISISRQILLNGTTRYLINGRNAQVTRVRQLFHSVLLNVNNPHFLIMQGHITKVLGMSPRELLQLLEEAAGTAMFQDQKTRVLRLLDRKQRKVDEIDAILDSDIRPQMEKLRADKKALERIHHSERKLERLSRMAVAAEFFTLERGEARWKAEEAGLRDGLRTLDAEKASASADFDRAKDALEQLRKERMVQSDADLSAALAEAEARVAAAGGRSDTARAEVGEAKARLGECEGAIHGLRARLAACGEKTDKFREQSRSLFARREELTTERDAAEATIAEISSGACLSGESLRERVGGLKVRRGALEGERASLQAHCAELERDLHAKRAELEVAAEKNRPLLDELQDLEERREALIARGDGAAIEGALSARRDELAASLTAAASDVSELQAQIQAIRGRIPGDIPKADARGGVMGVVGNLVKIPQKWKTAAESAAARRLLHVVVASFSDGKALLASGQLRRRTTIIPLDRIRPSRVPDAIRRRLAERRLGTLASELVECASAVRPAVQHVFGATVFCDTFADAKKVAFDPKLGLRAVTPDGDVLDPAGVINGGSRKTGRGSLLALFEALAGLQTRLHAAKARADALRKEIAGVDEKRGAEAQKTRELTSLEQRIHLARERLRGTRAVMLEGGADGLQRELDDTRGALAKAEAELTTVTRELREAEERVRGLSSSDETIARAKVRLTRARKELDALTPRYKKAVAQIEESEAAARALELETTRQAAELEAAQGELEAAIAKLKGCEDAGRKVQDAHRGVKAEYDRFQERLREEDSRLARAEEKVSTLRSKLSDLELRLREGQQVLQNSAQEMSSSRQRRDGLLEKHPWIRGKRAQFGKPGEFDFDAMDLPSMRREVARLTEELAATTREVNKHAAAQFERAERESRELFGKREKLTSDRVKIEETIGEFDMRKNNALAETYASVNRDLGEIFRRLLPGADARLEPVDGGDIFQGLRFAVALGGVWKESLSELSGGQRSLLALSLILSFLQYKPAPVYILDEVDAALDLSHTQTIGRLLKEKFAHAQFVVVSLKEGMFDNANVLFRTKFVNGVSTVRRFENK